MWDNSLLHTAGQNLRREQEIHEVCIIQTMIEPKTYLSLEDMLKDV
jgi:hypothetical protein